MSTREQVARIKENWPEALGARGECVLLAQRFAALMQESARQALAPHHLNLSEFEVLAALRSTREPHALNPSALYDALLLSSGGVTKVLKALEARGLIARPQSSGDRRQRPVSLTPAGRALAETAMADVMRMDAARLGKSSLSEADFRTLSALLGGAIEGVETER